MFIETRPLFLVRKLPRSDMTMFADQRRTGGEPAVHQRTCRSYGAWDCLDLRPSINMALLTELFRAGRLERRIRIAH